MNHVRKLDKNKPTAAKPIIICDVGGTLLNVWPKREDNTALIQLLNLKNQKGFDVRICTGAIDQGTWEGYSKKDLLKAGLDPQIIANARGKDDITPETFSNVVAIIDDCNESYIKEIIAGNPNARWFEPKPQATEELLRHLNVVKARGAFQGAA